MIQLISFFHRPEFLEAWNPEKFINNPEAGSPVTAFLSAVTLSSSAREAAL
ncbi:MAG TPA: hypothetical protein VL197_00850 [Nitrospirota bacterium]|nr:hypothetical protein [Nitrospirota bacterium]